jgi:hypothetical protein
MKLLFFLIFNFLFLSNVFSQSYNEIVANNLSKLNKKERSLYDSVSNALQKTDIWKHLSNTYLFADEKNSYLRLLDAIGQMIISGDTTSKDWGILQESTADKINNNESFFKFWLGCLMMEARGGLSPELVAIIKKYDSLDLVFQNVFNHLSCLIDPNNKDYLDIMTNQIKEGKYRFFVDDNDKKGYKYNFLRRLKDFELHLKKVYPASNYFKKEEKKEEYEMHPQKLQSSNVYICNGSNSQKYHKSNGCKGIKKCTREISLVSKQYAVSVGYTSCYICY